jgi:hypothetical protein
MAPKVKQSARSSSPGAPSHATGSSAGRRQRNGAIAAETHAIVEGSRRIPLAGSRALGSVNPHASIEVTLKLRRKKKLPELAG